jgi:hypothetical protein
MSKTKKPSSRAGRHGASPKQPRLLGWLMIVGGAFSTWCWYRPLPKNKGLPTIVSVSTKPLPDASGDAQGLVLPSIAEPGNAASQTLRTTAVNELPPDLVGEGEVALQPYQENRHRELQERVGTEPLPVIPIESPLVTLGRPNPKPPLWTNGLGPDPRSLMATQATPRDPSSLQAAKEPERDSPSPFRAGVLVESGSRGQIASAPKSWPDEAYRSDINQKIEFRSDRPSGSVASNATHNLPSFHQRDTRDASAESVMSLSSNRIRTEETERSIQSLPRLDAAAEPSLRPRSTGNVIRQPRSPSRP